MTFGYDSNVLFGKSRSQIYDYAIDLANRLKISRQKSQERHRPLVFICHSLGGVVFKEFLVQVTLNKDSELLAQSVAGVIFLGCPHRGSRVASHARLLSKIVNAATLGSGARSDLLKTLQMSSTELKAVSLHAMYPLKSLVIVSFYEQQPTGQSLVKMDILRPLNSSNLVPRSWSHFRQFSVFQMSVQFPSTQITAGLLMFRQRCLNCTFRSGPLSRSLLMVSVLAVYFFCPLLIRLPRLPNIHTS